MMNQIRNPNDEIILRRGDCFDHLADLPDRSIRAVIMDPPYGTMKAKWDRKLDLAKFWASIEPKLLPNAIVASFAAGKFLFELQRSNPQQYRYDLIWRKDRGAGFLNSGFRPLISHEMILIFAAKISRSVFNPQNTACEFRPRGIQLKRTASRRSTLYGRESRETTWIDDGRRHPTSVLDFACCRGADRIRIHPTQKPLDLLRWLVRTYSNPGDLIVDPFAGGGTTAVAALVEGRRFWGCEKDRKFHAAATRRIRESAAPARAAA